MTQLKMSLNLQKVKLEKEKLQYGGAKNALKPVL